MRMRADDGQTTVLVLGVSIVVFAVAGLAVDGTNAFLLRRTLQNAADSAALAGAGEIDRTAYYESGGTAVALEPGAARARAGGFLDLRGLPGVRADIRADREHVSVILRATSTTSFLRLVGITAIPVAAAAVAEPFEGSVP